MYTTEKDFSTDLLVKFIKKHQKDIKRFDTLEKYYIGNHDILNRKKTEGLSNNQLVCNHAKHITDTAVGYFVGSPIKYNGEKIESLVEWLQKADSVTTDMDVAKDCSVFGCGFEMVYMSNEKTPTPRVVSIDPRNCFVVYDNTVEHNPKFGVYYYPIYSEENEIEKFVYEVTTEQKKYSGKLDKEFEEKEENKEEPNPFKMVTIIEYWNNEEAQGDFEPVTTLIDAYNTLQSDRVNDKEQFVDAILLLINATMGDDEEEQSKNYKSLMESKILELKQPSGEAGKADARWLTRELNEADVEILRKSIESDIHKFTGIPCLTDENFAGNSSGVAMRYKLLGFEQVTAVKERYFKEGLKQRLKLFTNIMGVKAKSVIRSEDIQIQFTRNLPVNENEIADLVSTLEGFVPLEILLSQLPFVKDPKKAIEMLEKEKEKNIERTSTAFKNSPVGDNDEQE